jgi:signal transduction histidine kinase
MRRLPVESSQPIMLFAVLRLALALIAFVALLVLGLPYGGRAAAVVGGLGIPWSVAVLLIARRNPSAALNPLIAVGDFTVLLMIELVVPDIVGAVRYAAIFLIAVHAHFQGERRGIALGAGGSLALVIGTAIRGGTSITGGKLAFYETVFVVASVSAALVVGRLRTTESASRLRARRLSRRTLQAESEARRRVAEAIHDGPVQELIGLDMILSAAARAAAAGDNATTTELVEEARSLTERNIRNLRQEIVDLGPYAFQELSFNTAIENCIPAWDRRYGFEVMATLEAIDLPPEVAGDLFRIAQEAVVNAGRHADAQAVSISLRRVGRDVELRVTDNGHGFGDADPIGASEPGHLGLATMRERAELLEGTLSIETSPRGTKVVARVPLPQPVPEPQSPPG